MMHKNQRYNAIMRALELAGSCSVNDLMQRLSVSDETVRRDIKVLEAQGLVNRVHGGVVLPDAKGEADFRKRMNQQPEEKRALAALAARQVRNGDTLMIDSGSTTTYVAQALLGHRDLFVITNGTEIARILGRGTGNRVHVTGGEVRPDDNGIFGETAVAFMRQFRTRLAILSIGAVHRTSGFMDFHLQEAEIARCMIEQSLSTMVVADHTKFSNLAPVAVCGFDRVNMLVCDQSPPPDVARQMAENDGLILSCDRKNEAVETADVEALAD
ncbi:DeoR/GlpR family DNA-binding transcription regulator [Jiella marina]|uniref:DeoR/GlpR family DNA-binding transcription regulator n=1 Tax=Jiella sp. LLJ827 TaxID=2917712 RepID=UPI002101A4E3|nr:DeoR/GlpR family DNA-binding transcription regulator [Jiella sp. LLJ827]MCQ0988768.1 DeoR/GlpR family DNA-binding transcription regulator [Jiella sp. LLJ827]